MPDKVVEINTKEDLSRFARAHEDGSVNWETEEGPGGTIIVTEHDDASGGLSGLSDEEFARRMHRWARIDPQAVATLLARLDRMQGRTHG